MVEIKNFEMPHNCYDCDLHNYHECDITNESIEEDYCWNGDSREKHCPLREVEAIPKVDYEARLKADMVAMLTEIQLEIEEKKFLESSCSFMDKTEEKNYAVYTDNISDIIQQKIDALKAKSEPQESEDNNNAISLSEVLDNIKTEINELSELNHANAEYEDCKRDVLEILNKYISGKDNNAEVN